MPGAFMIREATLDDVPGIIGLGKQIHAASTYNNTPFNPNAVSLKAVTMIRRDFSTILLAEHDGNPVGVLPAWISPSFFCNELIACEQVVYVSPEYRRYRHGIALIKTYVAWAKRNNASDIRIGNIGGMTDDDNYGRLLARLGFTRTGGMYVMR
jgi:GNAT superfamily N-acetyltransferase